MRVRSRTNMRLSSVPSRQYLTVTGDSLLQQLNDLLQIKTKDAIKGMYLIPNNTEKLIKKKRKKDALCN